MFGTAFRRTTVTNFVFRGNITSKRGNKNFYKGRGAPSMGHHAAHGKYLIDREKYARQTFSVPNLKGFELKPYVALHTKRYQVPRPKMIIDVNFKKVRNEQAQLRLAEIEKIKANVVAAKAKGARSGRHVKTSGGLLLKDLHRYKQLRDQERAINQSIHGYRTRRKDGRIIKNAQENELRIKKSIQDEVNEYKKAIADKLDTLPTLSAAAKALMDTKKSRSLTDFLKRKAIQAGELKKAKATINIFKMDLSPEAMKAYKLAASKLSPKELMLKKIADAKKKQLVSAVEAVTEAAAVV
jgi:large subunit ribosomal protein L41